MSQTQPSHPGSLIEDHVARNSIIVHSIQLCISLVAVVALSLRAFPVLNRSVLFAMGRAENYLTPQGVGSVRVNLLLVAAMMTAFEAINNISMIADVWNHGHANFILYQVVEMLTFNPSGPLFVIAMAHRISCIIVMRPTWKLWFLRVVTAAAVLILCQSSIIVLFGILKRLDLDTAGWLKARLFPSWTAITISLLPLFTIGGSIWSLRVAFVSGPSPAGSSYGSQSSPPSQITAKSSLPPSSTPSSQQPSAATSSASSNTFPTIKYSLTTTFKVLTILMLVYWILFIAFTVSPDLVPFIRVRAATSLLITLSIATELSFERLLRFCRRRGQQQQQHASQTPMRASMMV